MAASIKEVVPKGGMVFYELELNPIFCKPKLLPLKSVTLEKLEKMQREAQEKVREMERLEEEEKRQSEQPSLGVAEQQTMEQGLIRPSTSTARRNQAAREGTTEADVWSAGNEGEVQSDTESLGDV